MEAAISRLKAWARGSAKPYLVIFGWLVALTIVEVVIAQLPMAKRTLATLLVATALVKAGLVALYFMHLRHEVKLLLSVAVFPVVLGLVFVLGLFPDIVIGRTGP